MSSQSKTFDFVKLNKLPEKPRKTGVIEFRGPYYTPVTYGYLSDLQDEDENFWRCGQGDDCASRRGRKDSHARIRRNHGRSSIQQVAEGCSQEARGQVRLPHMDVRGFGPARLQMVPQDFRKGREPLHRPFANCRVQRLASGTLGRPQHLERKKSQLSEHQMRREGPSGESSS